MGAGAASPARLPRLVPLSAGEGVPLGSLGLPGWVWGCPGALAVQPAASPAVTPLREASVFLVGCFPHKGKMKALRLLREL